MVKTANEIQIDEITVKMIWSKVDRASLTKSLTLPTFFLVAPPDTALAVLAVRPVVTTDQSATATATTSIATNPPHSTIFQTPTAVSTP